MEEMNHVLTTEGSTSSLCVRRVSVLLAGREREDGDDDDEEELEDDDDKERHAGSRSP